MQIQHRHLSQPPADPRLPPQSRAGLSVKRTEERPTANVARFITDQIGDPLVKLGEDGHFPELQLIEELDGKEASHAAQPPKNSSPVLLIAAFCCSVGLSLALLFVDIESFGSSGQKKAVARHVLSAFYGNGAAPLQPYQKALRAARNAASQGHTVLERQRYREVLELLRSEDKNPITGLTSLDRGAQDQFAQLTNKQLDLLGEDFMRLKNDEKLARLISILLE